MKDSHWAKVERNKEMRLLVIGGSTFVAVARKYGISFPCVRGIVLRECRKINSDKFDAGILEGATNNYKTPPLSYLRDNAEVFGV